MREMALRLKREGASVARHWPAMRMAWERRRGRVERKDSETMMAAAAPSEVGQHWSFVRGAWTVGDERIWSRV